MRACVRAYVRACVCVCVRETDRDREIERPRDRQTDRQRQTAIERKRQTEIAIMSDGYYGKYRQLLFPVRRSARTTLPFYEQCLLADG